MFKIFKGKFEWHIIVLSVGVLIFSLLCWGAFAKNAGSAIRHHFIDDKDSIDAAFKETNENEESGDSSVNNDDTFYPKYYDIIDSEIDKLDSQWSEHMFKKSHLSRIDFVVTYFGMGEILSSQVLFGSDNWLFYKNPKDGDPIGDFEGTNRYSNSEMQSIFKTAYAVQNELNSRGIELAILVAPNKENIYAEFMPDTYKHEEISSTDILVNYLMDRGVNMISPKRELLDNHAASQLYYTYDTHWNQLGAYIGVKDTLASWNIQMPELSKRSVTSSYLRDNYHLGAVDDLAKIVGLRSLFNDEFEYEVDGTITTDWERFEQEQSDNKISHFHNENAQVKASVLLVGDSFRTSMIPALREMYEDVYVVYRSYYEPEMLDEVRPDFLIAEYVERYSSGIGDIDLLLQ